jgi:phage N-6-adenine-methyltransferase
MSGDIDLFTSSETDEWATPPEFVRPLTQAFNGYELDAASGAEDSPIAQTVFQENGKQQTWFGDVWCNPPYSEMVSWTNKVVAEATRDQVDSITYLVKGDTSTEWWHTAINTAEYVAMIDHRLAFGDGENNAPFASHVFLFGDIPDKVLSILNSHGVVFNTDGIFTETEQQTL